MKHLNDLTIKEFYKYKELIMDNEPDIFSLFELFGEDAEKMKVDEFNKKWEIISTMKLSTNKVKQYYKINDVIYYATLNPLNLKAGQFIDFQNYMKKDFELHKILSVFLIPTKRKFFKNIVYKYNDGYDIFDVQNNILNNMKIGDANELSAFFLTWSLQLSKVMKDCLELKKYKMMKKQQKKKK